MGVDITHVDVGGGLGVDYDGSGSTSQASVNYTLQEYADDVIYTLAEACREHELPMPHIISESGRALTAHHALLLLSVIDVESQADNAVPELTEEHHTLCTRWRPTTRRCQAGVEEARARGVSRRDVRQGARAGTLQQRRPHASRPCDRGTDLSVDDRRGRQDRAARPRRILRHHRRSRGDDGGPVLLQFLAVPVAAGQLGDRSDLPDHADTPAQRGADAARHDSGRHLRLRRQDRAVHRRPDLAPEPASCTRSTMGTHTSSVSF